MVPIAVRFGPRRAATRLAPGEESAKYVVIHRVSTASPDPRQASPKICDEGVRAVTLNRKRQRGCAEMTNVERIVIGGRAALEARRRVLNRDEKTYLHLFLLFHFLIFISRCAYVPSNEIFFMEGAHDVTAI